MEGSAPVPLGIPPQAMTAIIRTKYGLVDHRDVIHRMAPSISELWGLITINPGGSEVRSPGVDKSGKTGVRHPS